jgi:hypothetical protein
MFSVVSRFTTGRCPTTASRCSTTGSAVTRLSGIAATVLTAALIAAPATAYADCGDPGQDSCTGPVPTPDQVAAIMDELTNPNIPAANKSDIVTPPFTDVQARRLDIVLNYLGGEGVFPLNFSVTDIQPAPNNLAGATVSNPISWHERHGGTGPVVLAYQDGHWFITRDTALARVNQLSRDLTIHIGGI